MPKTQSPPKVLIRRNKKCLYLKALRQAERLDFQMAAGVEGVDDEITLLRVMIITCLEKEPLDVRLILAVINLLARLVQIRYGITPAPKKGFKESLGNVIKDIALPLGVVTLSKKLS